MTGGNDMDHFEHRADATSPIQGGAANSKSSRRRRREPYAWLGLGALGLGVGAALAAGSGVAYADTAESGASSSQSESPGRASSAAGHAGKSAANKGAAKTPPSRSKGRNDSADRAVSPVAASERPTLPSAADLSGNLFAEAAPQMTVSNVAQPVEVSATALPIVVVTPAEPIAVATPAPAPLSPGATIRSALAALGLGPSSPLAPPVNLRASIPRSVLRKTESTLDTSVTPMAAASAPATPSSVTYGVGSDWGSGHTAALTVNAGSSALNGWTVEFDSPAQITNIWNAQITSHVGTHYVISNMSYNAKVASGQSTSFGYQATPGAVASKPTNLKVNGVASGNPPTVPAISIADVAVAEGNSGTTGANFTVTLSTASANPVTVGYSTTNGTATAGADYTAASGTLTFAPGVTSQTIAVKITGDGAVESNESFTVALTNPTGATLARASATATITNDDVASPPQQGANSVTYSVANDWGSGHNANMTVNAGEKLTGWTVEFDSPAQITNIWNAKITSHVGTHYVISNMSYNGNVAAGGSTSFGYQATPGAVASTPTNIKVNGVAVSNPPSTPTLSITDKSVSEGNSGTSNATFTVALSSASTTPVTVAYSTANGTATAGSDYTATSGTLTFAPGVTSQTVNVSVLGDTANESNETFAVALSNPSGATILRGTATGTITNDDQAQPTQPSASIADLAITEGNGEHAHFMFTVTLSKASDTPVTIQYATADGTATGGADFAVGSGTLTFAPGVTTQNIHVDVKGDALAESSETFTVKLSNPSGVAIARGTATGTIIDDDVAGGPTYIDITAFGVHGGSSHTDHTALAGGRTAITTEALVAYNNLREFAGIGPATLEQIGTWAFANKLTNNAQPSGQDLPGVGLYYAMQGAKVGWIADDKFDPQLIADIERTARLGSPADVMAMVAQYDHDGFAEFLTAHGYETAFINTLKMEPHYGGFMHSRAHGGLSIEGVATAHDVNHLTVLSHDQTQPFMNDTWDWPQWPALDVSHAGVLEYFQSMVELGNPLGQNLTALDASQSDHDHSGHAM